MDYGLTAGKASLAPYKMNWTNEDYQMYYDDATGLESSLFLDLYGYTWIIYLVVCGILALLITCGNLIVIIVLAKNKKLRNPQAIYKISIAISDLITGAIILLFHIVMWAFPSIIAGLGVFLLMGLLTALSVWVSLTNLTISGIDRLFAVLYPLKCKIYIREVKRGAIVTTATVWIHFMIISVFAFFYPERFLVFIALQFYGMESICKGECVGVIDELTLIVWINNIFILLAVRRQHKKMRSSVASQQFKKEINLAKTLFIMTIAFTISLLPYVLVLILVSNDILFESAPQKLLHVVILISYSNSFWNCVIYSFRNKQFRDAVKNGILIKMQDRSLFPTTTRSNAYVASQV